MATEMTPADAVAKPDATAEAKSNAELAAAMREYVAAQVAKVAADKAKGTLSFELKTLVQEVGLDTMPPSAMPSGDAILRVEKVDGLALVDADWLQKAFGLQGPFWSRHYRFFRGGKALTVIREVFSPQLETWLGPTLRQELQRSS